MTSTTKINIALLATVIAITAHVGYQTWQAKKEATTSKAAVTAQEVSTRPTPIIKASAPAPQ